MKRTCPCPKCHPKLSAVDNLLRQHPPRKFQMTRDDWELICFSVLMGVVLVILLGLWTGALG